MFRKLALNLASPLVKSMIHEILQDVIDYVQSEISKQTKLSQKEIDASNNVLDLVENRILDLVDSKLG
jgi:hypothetical protein